MWCKNNGFRCKFFAGYTATDGKRGWKGRIFAGNPAADGREAVAEDNMDVISEKIQEQILSWEE